MLRIYGCIVEQHDLRLVVLAALICLFTCFTAVDLFVRARDSARTRGLAWLSAAATVFGSGVWATHFVAELAYNPGFPLGYDIGLTALSAVIAMSVAWLGMLVALWGEAPMLGGAVVGAAVGAMHYVGMTALRVPAELRWDARYVLASLAIGVLLSVPAIRILCQASASAWPRRLGGALLLVAAICGLHFTGMAAVVIVPNPLVEVSGQVAAPQLLAIAIAAVTAVIIALGLSGSIVDHRLARQNAREAERLRKSEARLIDAIEAFPEGFALYDAADRFVLCNGRYRQMYGESADLMQPGARFEDIIRAGAERGQYAMGSASTDGRVKHWLEMHAKPDAVFEQQLATGEWFRVSDRRTSDGGVISVSVDITELKQREATFRLLFESNPLPMMVYDFRTWRYLEVNNAAVTHYGYSRDQFLAMTIEQIRPPEDLERLRRARATASAALRQLGLWRHVKADGSIILVDVTVHQLPFRGHNAALVVAIDVTERERAAAALRESEAQLRRSQQHLARAQRVAGMGSIELNLKTGEAECTDETFRLLGVDPATFVATAENLLQLVHEEDRAQVRAGLVASQEGVRPLPLEYRIVRPDGEILILRREAELTLDDAGEPSQLFVTVKDVTELRTAEERHRNLERQLLHAHKLEALGTLAGGIAHDLNNTLVPVLGLAKLTMKRLPEESRERANLAMILKAGERGRDLVRQILAFSRKDAPTRQTVDLALLVSDSLKMLHASLPATIQIVEAIESAPMVSADPAQLHQIVVNFIVNAAQAIGEKMGTITVALKCETQAPREIASHQGQIAHLSVRDTGCGMDEATVQRIFEPFFTTKPVGVGTGLGLSVVDGIVAQHGGCITVQSSQGTGTCFHVYLPALSGEEPKQRLETGEAAD